MSITFACALRAGANIDRIPLFIRNRVSDLHVAGNFGWNHLAVGLSIRSNRNFTMRYALPVMVQHVELKPGFSRAYFSLESRTRPFCFRSILSLQEREDWSPFLAELRHQILARALKLTRLTTAGHASLRNSSHLDIVIRVGPLRAVF